MILDYLTITLVVNLLKLFHDLSTKCIAKIIEKTKNKILESFGGVFVAPNFYFHIMEPGLDWLHLVKKFPSHYIILVN